MSASQGQWGAVFELPNVAIHAHVLPNGSVLMWGRRDHPTDSLDVHECTPFVWNPVNKAVTPTPQPRLADGTKVNLFCSGHTFLPDGRLLVIGGHWKDQEGLNQAAIYDPATNAWAPTAVMNHGRWYPTATTLPDGSVLALSGSFRDPTQPPGKQIVVNDLLQVWRSGAWSPIIDTVTGTHLTFEGLPLYPRMHVTSDGRLFMSGARAQTDLLKTTDPGLWTPLGNPGGTRAAAFRDYCPAVMYDQNKVLYIGGGNDPGTHLPTSAVERIDLSETPPRWRPAQPMHFRRRQHNATVLPDGTVLVTGGTQGGGGLNNGFNDLAPGQPVHTAELWDPATGTWTQLAAEQEDRCYHATAVLLPDATVLSAGGGEYRPDNVNPNNPKDSHRNSQIFSPPYLFKGARPQLTAAPASVTYGENFDVSSPQASDIGKVSWIRLPSVTHAFDQNQHINFLQFKTGAGKLTLTAPNSANLCPPGHYMLFLVNKNGVPSIAKIIQIRTAAAPAPHVAAAATGVPERESVALSPDASGPGAPAQVFDRQAAVIQAAKGTAVVIGITGTCPYGIAACWGGAHEALHHLVGVDLVNPVPNADDSTAEVYLEDDRLPALDQWDQQFASSANGSYELRGVEVTLQGVVEAQDGKLVLAGSGERPPVQLAPLAAADKIQWIHAIRERQPLQEEEALAYEKLAATSRSLPAGQQVTVTGPLKQADGSYQLQVRLFRS